MEVDKNIQVKLVNGETEVIYYNRRPYLIMNFDKSDLRECLSCKDIFEDYFKNNTESYLNGTLFLTQMEYASCLNRIIKLTKNEK